MAVPANCYRFVYRGSLPNGEKWQTGWWMVGSAPTSNASATAGAQVEFSSEGGASASSWWNVFKSLVPSSVTFDQVAVYSYPSGGTTAAFIGVSSTASLVGTSAGVAVPNQICVVLSLLTGAAGRSQRGRMFLPGIAANNLTSTGLYNLSAMTSIANVWGVKFQNFNAVSGSIGVPSVVSQTHTSSLQCLSVRADTRPDVQRRRSNKTTGITAASHAAV